MMGRENDTCAAAVTAYTPPQDACSSFANCIESKNASSSRSGDPNGWFQLDSKLVGWNLVGPPCWNHQQAREAPSLNKLCPHNFWIKRVLPWPRAFALPCQRPAFPPALVPPSRCPSSWNRKPRSRGEACREVKTSRLTIICLHIVDHVISAVVAIADLPQQSQQPPFSSSRHQGSQQVPGIALIGQQLVIIASHRTASCKGRTAAGSGALAIVAVALLLCTAVVL